MSGNNATHMMREIAEIPEATARLLDQSGDALAQAGKAIGKLDPAFLTTVARGSSDHAAAFLKYAIELAAGVPVASLGPSIASIYGARLKLAKSASLAISQSGKSPDIVSMATSARTSGGLTIALTNTAGSPLAAAADIAIDIRAGEEKSVAATKSFVTSVVAGLALVAHAAENERLKAALNDLPRVLETAVSCDWSPLFDALTGASSLYVLGRGPSLAIANEAALKFKETCGLHAEAYSAAEVLHGPSRIVEAGFPVLALTADDAAAQSVVDVVDRLAGQGARAFITSTKSASGTALPAAAAGDPLTGTLAIIVSFYAFVEELSHRRGFDPDRPPYLKKVTETK
jgi:glucosamine--fructose-6-phosphate aminotransferase (isomerizing)